MLCAKDHSRCHQPRPRSLCTLEHWLYSFPPSRFAFSFIALAMPGHLFTILTASVPDASLGRRWYASSRTVHHASYTVRGGGGGEYIHTHMHVCMFMAVSLEPTPRIYSQHVIHCQCRPKGVVAVALARRASPPPRLSCCMSQSPAPHSLFCSTNIGYGYDRQSAESRSGLR